MALQVLHTVLTERASEVADGARRRASGEDVLTHVPTGLPEFDEEFGGLEIGVLTLLVGQTGIGKTSVAAKFVESAARAGLGVLAYFVEDPKSRTADKYLSGQTGIAARDMARLRVGPGEVEDIRRAADQADWARRVAVRFGPVDAEEILADVARVRSVGGAPVREVLVDYAQALANEGNLEETCANTARALNVIAGERGLATVFGSQVKTEVTQRGRQRWERNPGDVSGFLPGLGDAMWSRRLEQYAKCAITPHRPGYWKRQMGEEAADNTMELHVYKANFGPTGWAELGWDGERTRIYSLRGS